MDLVDKPAGELIACETCILEPTTRFRSPPVAFWRRRDVGTAAKHALAKLRQRLPRPKPGIQPDNGDRLRGRGQCVRNETRLGLSLRDEFLEQDVGIDAAEAKAANRGATRLIIPSAMPCLCLVQHAERTCSQVDLLLRCAEV